MPALTHGRVVNGFNLLPRDIRFSNKRNASCCDKKLCCGRPLQYNRMQVGNIYKYKRDIHALFFEYTAQINEKWSVKHGIRAEYVDKNIVFTGLPDAWYCNQQEFDSYDDCVISGCENCELTSDDSNQLCVRLSVVPARANQLFLMQSY